MHSLNSEYPFLRVSDVLHFALWNIFRSCWFFIFMHRKLNYICIKLICHFLYFFSVLSRSTKDVFSFWKLAKKGEAWAKTNASRKLVQPCHKSFQRAVQWKHGLATQVRRMLYLYWCCICALQTNIHASSTWNFWWSILQMNRSFCAEPINTLKAQGFFWKRLLLKYWWFFTSALTSSFIVLANIYKLYVVFISCCAKQ